jgi:hypothetical protein
LLAPSFAFFFVLAAFGSLGSFLARLYVPILAAGFPPDKMQEA